MKIRLIVVAAVMLLGPRAMAMQTATPQSPPSPAANPAAPVAAVAGAAAPAGRAGRGNPAATLYTEICAGCHGAAVIAGPRGPSLLDDQWAHGADDESIVKNIREGFPAAGMPPFKESLTDQQIWQMVAYIHLQAGNLKDRPEYVPDPDGQVIKSEKQAFKVEIVARNLETPWALAFLPDGRLLITERPGRLRIVDHGRLLPDPVKGLPKVWEKQDGGLFDVEVHPQYSRNEWIYLSYSETLPGYVPPPPAAADATTTTPATTNAPASSTLIARGSTSPPANTVRLSMTPSPSVSSSTATSLI
ncbi:MAG: hypothetical protein DMF84_21540, partial [Acidobacteria bacterium]